MEGRFLLGERGGLTRLESSYGELLACVPHSLPLFTLCQHCFALGGSFPGIGETRAGATYKVSSFQRSPRQRGIVYIRFPRQLPAGPGIPALPRSWIVSGERAALGPFTPVTTSCHTASPLTVFL